jgi:hypothetical protein
MAKYENAVTRRKRILIFREANVRSERRILKIQPKYLEKRLTFFHPACIIFYMSECI